MAREIAPVLTGMFRDDGCTDEEWEIARHELRALKRVAKEAAVMAGLTKSCHANGGQTCCQEWHLVRAVDALARLQRKEPKR